MMAHRKILVAREQNVDIRVLQSESPLPTDANVAARVYGCPLHRMGHSILESDAQKLVFMLPPQSLYEQTPYPLDQPTLARSGRAVTEA